MNRYRLRVHLEAVQSFGRNEEERACPVGDVAAPLSRYPFRHTETAASRYDVCQFVKGVGVFSDGKPFVFPHQNLRRTVEVFYPHDIECTMNCRKDTMNSPDAAIILRRILTEPWRDILLRRGAVGRDVSVRRIR